MKNKFFALALAALGFAQPAMADNFVVSYDGFHDRLKVIEKGEFEFARVNFYIVDIASLEPCKIAKGKIVTENSETPLTYTDEAQLLLPYDDQLDKDKAVIVIEPQNPRHDCQLKFQIEAEHFGLDNLTKADIYQLHHEFDELLSDLSGFFVSKLMGFLLPSQKGISVKFDSDVNFNQSGVSCADKVCKFTVEDSWEGDDFKFTSDAMSAKPVLVTPWIEK
jgi:hypothetical protein